MDRDKQNAILLGGVVLIVAAIWVRGLTVPVGRRQAPSGIVTPAAGSRPIGAPVARGRTTFSGWGRNPFTLAGELTEGVRGLVLEGIVWDEERPLAVINDRVVGVGDTLRQGRIVTITQTEVFLEDNAETFSLRLGEKRLK